MIYTAILSHSDAMEIKVPIWVAYVIGVVGIVALGVAFYLIFSSNNLESFNAIGF